MALRLEEFLIWSVEQAEALVSPFLELLFDVCHVVLGLRPQCRHRERDIGEFVAVRLIADLGPFSSVLCSMFTSRYTIFFKKKTRKSYRCQV